jgi:hypothetical protein
MEPNVLAGQWRDIAFHGTTGDAKIKDGPFTNKFVTGKDHRAA